MNSGTQQSYVNSNGKNPLLYRNKHVKIIPDPYPHIQMGPVLDADDAEEVLCWLQRCNSWRREVRTFARYDAIFLTPTVVPDEAKPAVSRSLLGELRNTLQSRLGVNLESFALIEAHRSQQHDYIGLHTDESVNEVRLALNLNSYWNASNGGLLSLQDRPLLPRYRVAYCPLHNSAVAFRTTTASHHEISLVKKGVRYTLLYRFPVASPTRSQGGLDFVGISTYGVSSQLKTDTIIMMISDQYRWPAI